MVFSHAESVQIVENDVLRGARVRKERKAKFSFFVSFQPLMEAQISAAVTTALNPTGVNTSEVAAALDVLNQVRSPENAQHALTPTLNLWLTKHASPQVRLFGAQVVGEASVSPLPSPNRI